MHAPKLVPGVAMILVALPAVAGDLNPPAGPIAPTLKTLEQAEPRTPISDATTPGDADSIYKIVAPGSYYLTGEILGQPGKFGIEVASSNVTIDLMGFSMRATPGNGLSAIYTGFGAGLKSVAVVNGAIDGWIDGVDLTGVDGGRVENIHSVDAQNNAIYLGTSIVVRACTAIHPAGYAFADQGRCRYSHCIARDAGFDGFGVAEGGALDHCTAETNTGNGFHVTSGPGCSFHACNASANGASGIQAGFGGSIVGCTAVGNGAHGIYIVAQCVARDNECSGNGVSTTGAGIYSNGVDNRIEANNCVDNDVGIDVTTSGNLVVRNSASGNTSANYAVSITNTSTNPTTAGPWDNLAY